MIFCVHAMPKGRHCICELIVTQDVTIQMPDAFPTRGFPECEKDTDYIVIRMRIRRYVGV